MGLSDLHTILDISGLPIDYPELTSKIVNAGICLEML